MASATKLRVVTTNNVEVFRHLGSGPFQRLDVDHHVAADYAAALAAVKQHVPRIAILDVELAGGKGTDLCRAIKDDPSLARVHVMMVLSSVISRETLAALQQCGCDDVLAVPIHSDDFYHHIAQVAGLPLRRERRVGVSLELRIPDASAPLEGVVENISASGAGVLVDGELTKGEQVTARLIHDGTTYPDMDAVVAWTGASDRDGRLQAGLAFGDLPMKTRLLLERLCLYDLAPNPGGGVTVCLYGDFTEITDFSALGERLANEDPIDFYMRSVRYISSAGVRAWCDFLSKIDGKTYSFRHCSLAFASQAAMVPMAVGDGHVISVEAPYHCEACDRDDLRLLETKALVVDSDPAEPPALNCTECGAELEFDDVPERYFAFLRR